MVATTWNNRSHWQTAARAETPPRAMDAVPRGHVLPVVEDGDRAYVISHAGLLQRNSGLGDFVHHISRGVLIFPLVLAALAVPVVTPLLELGQYMLLVLCFSHLILAATVLTVWAIAISYLDVRRGEEALEARPMTASDGDPSMGARSPRAKPKHAA